MLLTKRDGRDDETKQIIADQKAAEMEDRRRNLEKSSSRKRELRRMHIERQEAAEAERLQRAKEAADRKVRQTERTRKLAEELARRKHVELQESLKSKKSKSAASSLSDQQLKKLETELTKGKTRDQGQQSPDDFGGLHFAEDSPEQELEKKLRYRRDLQNQLIFNRRRLFELEEEKHRERKILEEAVEMIREEDAEAKRRKKEITALLQAERDAFLKARQLWKDKRRELLKREHEEIARLIYDKEARQKTEAERKTDVRLEHEALVEQLANAVMEKEQKRREREEICRDLYMAQKEYEIIQSEEMEALMKKRTAREMLRDMARHRKAIAEKRAKEHAIDAAFAKHVAEEQRNEEEKARRKQQERREKLIEYGKELKETIMENSIRRAKKTTQMKHEESKGNVEKLQMKCYSESILDTFKSGL